MTALLACLHLILGSIYTGYGILTVIDMRRGWRTFGFSHFGMAWITMAFTCGPHHLDHGLHVTMGSGTKPLDVAVVLLGAPAGVTWFLLRVEAFNGGRGDRAISGTPAWFRAVFAAIGAAIATAIVWLAVELVEGPVQFSVTFVPNVLLVVTYCMIGYYLGRAQLAHRAEAGGWSVSGLSLTVVFPTCALMHLTHLVYAVTGSYAPDVHGTFIDWLSVPASVYFLWVVRDLWNGVRHDWNDGPAVASGEGQPGEGSPAPAVLAGAGG